MSCGLTAGQEGGGTQVPSRTTQPPLLQLSYCVYQVLISSFTSFTHCGVSGVNEDMWMQEENLQGEAIAKQVSFLRKSRGLFQFPLPPIFHLSSCHTLQELWQRDPTAFDPFMRQSVWTCGSRLLLSRAPTSVPATPPSSWEPIPCH